jgi:hypothetical protein
MLWLVTPVLCVLPCLKPCLPQICGFAYSPADPDTSPVPPEFQRKA